ncbi:MAG: RNA-binding S4 domain-containing protein [Erysipelotrichaceae bacterium]|nr:RNA-binding S4 domain-containing protein [Erysipelotrichaceae bacterium]MBQ4570782.1 RNA-binding S4 domain-containing protein [Bacilli bacterium]
MRLDKYLKVSRLIKRRTLAKEASESERILVNDKIAKPSKELKIGDIITIEFGRKQISVKVLSLNPVIKKDDASNMYELISESFKD